MLCNMKLLILFALGGLSKASNCRGFYNSPPATSTCMQKITQNTSLPHMQFGIENIFLRFLCGGDARFHPEQHVA